MENLDSAVSDLQIKYATVETEVKFIKESMSRIETLLTTLINQLTKKIDSLEKTHAAELKQFKEEVEKKYAPKISWDIVRWTGAIIFSVVIVALIKTVIVR